MEKLTIETLNDCKDVYTATELVKIYYGKYPTKPSKPKLESLASSSRVLAYAKELEKYEDQMSIYETEQRYFQETQNEVNSVLEQYLKEQADLNSIPEKNRAKVWAKAYDHGHSSGYFSVYQELCELVELFI